MEMLGKWKFRDNRMKAPAIAQQTQSQEEIL